MLLESACVRCFWVAGGYTHIPCSISLLLSSWIARILFMVAGGEVALLLALALGLRKYGVVARLGEFWVTSVRLKAQKWRWYLVQGSPSAEQADLQQFLLIHLYFRKANDDHVRNTVIQSLGNLIPR